MGFGEIAGFFFFLSDLKNIGKQNTITYNRDHIKVNYVAMTQPEEMTYRMEGLTYKCINPG